MRLLAFIFLVLLTATACRTTRQVPAEVSSAEVFAKPETSADATQTDAPAQAQTSDAPAEVPSSGPFQASASVPMPPARVQPPADAVASTARKPAARYWQKSLAVPKLLLKTTQKQVRNIAKKRHPNDNSILGLRPILFFALLAVLAGVILLFVTGKSQFFSILTVVLLVGGLILSLGAFLDLI
jgi:hypothetical protein